MNTNPEWRSLKTKIFWIIITFTVIILTGCSSSPNITTTVPPSTQPSKTPAETAVASSNPSPTSTPAASPSVSPTPASSPSPTTEPTILPTSIFAPTATPYEPNAAQLDLFQYVLALINTDRQNQGLSPVTLNFNSAAQEHAEDMLKNQYLAHWGTDGQKPYMRYTLAGGLNYEQENSAYSYSSEKINVKKEIQFLEDEMMNHDEASNWGHRDNILNKWHKKVSLGIAYNNNDVALVQQFEGDYVEFYQPPTINGNILTLSGKFTQSGMVLNNVSINYDPLPQPIPATQLRDPSSPYHSYGLSDILGQVFPPPPLHSEYVSLPPNSIIAGKGKADQSGQFYIEADISAFLQNGPGVYTVALVPTSADTRNFTNYSIWVK